MAFAAAMDSGAAGSVRALVALTLTALLTWCFSTLPAQGPRFVPYDRDAAIILAGKQVPEEIDSFYFFVLDTDTTVDQDGEEMAFVLQRAALERDYLGIVGPDPERNRATLIHALDASQHLRLEGATVIYVGPQADEDLMQRIRDSGAELRFVVYPDESAPSI